MRRKVTLTVAALAAAGVAAAGLVAVMKPAPHAPAATTSEPSAASPAEGVSGQPVSAAPKPRAGRVFRVDEAVRELDLIRPSRQKLAEDFTVALVRGRTFRLSEQRGSAVLINFWATWCPPCREEMPAMERLYRQHKDHGFVMVAVSIDTDSSLVKPFVEQHRFTFPVALDPKLDLANAYGVRALPSSFVVDRKGSLVALALGPRAWDNDAAHSLVEGILRQ